MAYNEVVRARRKAYKPPTSELFDNYRDNDGNLIEKPFNPKIEVQVNIGSGQFNIWVNMATGLIDGERENFWIWIPDHAGTLVIAGVVGTIDTPDSVAMRISLNENQTFGDGTFWGGSGGPNDIQLEADVSMLRNTYAKLNVQAFSDSVTHRVFRTDDVQTDLSGLSNVDPQILSRFRAVGEDAVDGLRGVHVFS